MQPTSYHAQNLFLNLKHYPTQVALSIAGGKYKALSWFLIPCSFGA